MLLQSQEFKTSGTFTPTTGAIFLTMIGGGGGGGCSNSGVLNQTAAGGGGCGEFVRGILVPVTIGIGITVTLGAGGLGATNSIMAFNGGTSTFGSLVSCAGGWGGVQGGQNSTHIPYHQPNTGPSGGSGGGTYDQQGARGATGITPGTDGHGLLAGSEGGCWFGGSSAGGGGASNVNGGIGGTTEAVTGALGGAFGSPVTNGGPDEGIQAWLPLASAVQVTPLTDTVAANSGVQKIASSSVYRFMVCFPR